MDRRGRQPNADQVGGRLGAAWSRRGFRAAVGASFATSTRAFQRERDGVIRLTSVILILAILVSTLFLSWPWNLVVVLCAGILEVGEVVWGLRLARRWRPKTGPETMVGKTAVVVVPCLPSGQVRVHGELWEANCAAGAEIGEAVRIAALQDLTLVVEPTPLTGPGEAASISDG